MDIALLMLAPICECLVLVGIHSYLGIHVIRRGVIFIDLALAQIAALGAAVGILFGLMPDSTSAFIYSILFTFLGAGVFSVTRFRSSRIPQEAVIGLVYAIAAAAAILFIDRAPQGSEHLKEILVGRIVWVRWGEVASAAIAYALVGLIHVLVGKRFMIISKDPEAAYLQKMHVRLWDFIFYMTFGFVISFSVSVAGVLLVFVFLVVPAIAAILITDRLLWQLVIGWSMGATVTIAGMLISYFMNLPSGPAIVVLYGLALVAVATVVYVVRAREWTRAALRVALVAAAAAALILAMAGIGAGLGYLSKRSQEATPAHGQHGTGTAVGKKGQVDEAGVEDPDEAIERAEKYIEEGRRQEALEILSKIASSPSTPPFYRDRARQLLGGGKPDGGAENSDLKTSP
jgi:zinc/manganese transport system permease protein